MEKILIEESGRAQLGLFDVDWQKIQMSAPGLATSTRLTYIRNVEVLTNNLQDMQQLSSRLLMEKDPTKREKLVYEYVTDLLCSWTGNAPSDLDFNSSLYNYGMDSFSGLTFKMQLESSLHISFEVRIERCKEGCGYDHHHQVSLPSSSRQIPISLAPPKNNGL